MNAWWEGHNIEDGDMGEDGIFALQQRESAHADPHRRGDT